MRDHRTCAVLLGVGLSLAVGARAAAGAEEGEILHSGAIPYDLHGGLDVLSEEHRQAIEARLAANVALLRAEGKLPATTGAPVPLGMPLAPAPGLGVDEPWGIYYFVDQNVAFPNQILDYNCGSRTYDVADGYNHGGTDFTTWPWPWRMVAESGVHIVAAAPGTIIGKDDGFPDQSCNWSGQPFWNAVYVMHADGSVAWYGHMKTFSLTPKAVGEQVAAGEFLGIVGSSGRSSAPHLHFEVHDEFGAVNDPFAGPCSNLNPTSWWASQGPYYDSKVLRMTTGASPPFMPACPGIENSNELKDFTAPDNIFFTLYFRDLRFGQTIQHRVFNPDGSVNRSWDFTFTDTDWYSVAWWWWGENFPAGSPAGTYRWRATYDGQHYEYLFNIGVAPAGAVPAESAEGTPLTVAKGPGAGEITLAWGDSCRSSDSNYTIYQGILDSSPETQFYNYQRMTCSTDGEKTWTFTPTAGDLYWVVVPRNATRVGSYGTDSSGNERPQPFLRCLSQLFDCDVP